MYYYTDRRANHFYHFEYQHCDLLDHIVRLQKTTSEQTGQFEFQGLYGLYELNHESLTGNNSYLVPVSGLLKASLSLMHQVHISTLIQLCLSDLRSTLLYSPTM